MALGEALGNPLSLHELQTLRAERDAALQARDAAQALVAAYERGRFIRFMRWIKESVRG